MNKILLLTHIKGIIIVFKFSTEYNIDLSTTKKVTELSFCSTFYILCLNGFSVSICF